MMWMPMWRPSQTAGASHPRKLTKIRAASSLTVALLAISGCTDGGTDSKPAASGTTHHRTADDPGGVPSESPPRARHLRGVVAYSTPAGDIWVMNADGSHRWQVTHASGDNFDPSLAPNGRRLVFRTSRGTYSPDVSNTGVEGIFVVNTDGSREREIQPARGGLFPDWSPDGRRIAMSTVHADRTETIVTMNPDGSDVRDTGIDGGECSEWSPDSSRIAYCAQPGNGDFNVWVMNADGSHRRQLTRGVGRDYPTAWSPDGQRIAYSSERAGNIDVYVMHADGTRKTRLTTSPTSQAPVVWLPDDRIVYTSYPPNATQPSWFLMDPDGNRVRGLPQLQGAGDPIDWIIPR
jgi:Tol biopolymer transport system component